MAIQNQQARLDVHRYIEDGLSSGFEALNHCIEYDESKGS
jgi:hypothetical protein